MEASYVTKLQCAGQDKRDSLKKYAVSLSLTLVSPLWVRIPECLSTKVHPPQIGQLPPKQLTSAWQHRRFNRDGKLEARSLLKKIVLAVCY